MMLRKGAKDLSRMSCSLFGESKLKSKTVGIKNLASGSGIALEALIVWAGSPQPSPVSFLRWDSAQGSLL